MRFDVEMAKALSHPTRAHILRVLEDGSASPVQIARESGQPVSNVSYHVRVLQKAGCVRLLRTEQRRGALEHFYEATANDRSTADTR
jgi:DNA-binding transcriptional ArsR family regulator